MRYVIDSNVAVVANGFADQVSIDGQLTAATFLKRLMDYDIVLLDSEGLALDEYKKHLNFSGMPSMGDEFFAWVVREMWSGAKVHQVDSPASGSILDVLPDSLRSFDNDDHKWICIYLKGQARAIVNAVDSDWRNQADDLKREGVVVLELLD